MVDALSECWRVLEDGGLIVDLRPLHDTRAIEVMGEETIFVPGHIRYVERNTDDIACARAIEQVLQRGCFTRQMRGLFDFALYWEDLAGFEAFAEEKYCAKGRLTPDVLAGAREHVRSIEGPYRVCMRYRMHLAVYRKRVPPAVGSA